MNPLLIVESILLTVIIISVIVVILLIIVAAEIISFVIGQNASFRFKVILFSFLGVFFMSGILAVSKKIKDLKNYN